jgi:hypothetical protein
MVAAAPAGAEETPSSAPWDWGSIKQESAGLEHCLTVVVGSYVGDPERTVGAVRIVGNPGDEIRFSLACVAPATYAAAPDELGPGEAVGGATPATAGTEPVTRHPLGRRWALKFRSSPVTYTFAGHGPWGSERVVVVLEPQTPTLPLPKADPSPFPVASAPPPAESLRRWGGLVSVSSGFGTLYERHNWTVQGATDWIVPAFGATAPLGLEFGAEFHYTSLHKPVFDKNGLTGGISDWQAVYVGPHLGARLVVPLDAEHVGLSVHARGGVGWHHFWDLGAASDRGEELTAPHYSYVATMSGSLGIGVEIERLFSICVLLTGERTLEKVNVERGVSGIGWTVAAPLSLGYLGLELTVGRL